jgi:hypothetical protein
LQKINYEQKSGRENAKKMRKTKKPKTIFVSSFLRTSAFRAKILVYNSASQHEGVSTLGMGVEANEEVQKWAAEEGISDLLPTLSKHHYITMPVVRYIAAKDIEEMGLAFGGDKIRLRVAVENANKTACEPLGGTCLDQF